MPTAALDLTAPACPAPAPKACPATPPARRCRRCGRKHQTWRGVARCRWPKLLWLQGDGPWVSLSLCHPGSTAQLHRTRVEAERAKACVDEGGCGGTCGGAGLHRVVDLGA